jgi:outer membrane lipoprotein-sorting protein
MTKPIYKTPFFLLIVGLLLFTISCSSLIFPQKKTDQTPEISPAGLKILEALMQKQSVLKQFKAIGKISIDTGNNFQTSRAAWAVSYPYKLRIEFLAPTGQPTLSLSLDDTWLYIYSYQENRFAKKRKTGSYLKKLLKIPIKPDDAISLFAGHVPVDSPIIEAETTSTSDSDFEVMTLHYGNRNGKSRIFFDKQLKRVSKFEKYNTSGGLMYRAVLGNFLIIGDQWLPRQIFLEAPNHGVVKVAAERYWNDVTFDPEFFVLKPK